MQKFITVLSKCFSENSIMKRIDDLSGKQRIALGMD